MLGKTKIFGICYQSQQIAMTTCYDNRNEEIKYLKEQGAQKDIQTTNHDVQMAKLKHTLEDGMTHFKH